MPVFVNNKLIMRGKELLVIDKKGIFLRKSLRVEPEGTYSNPLYRF
jgi:hypothetical protein